MQIKSINRFGLVTVSFNNTLVMPSNFSEIDGSVLLIQVEAFNEEMQDLKGLDWKLKSFSPKRMELQLDFEYPELISDEVEGRDSLKIKVINPTYFTSKATL